MTKQQWDEMREWMLDGQPKTITQFTLDTPNLSLSNKFLYFRFFILLNSIFIYYLFYLSFVPLLILRLMTKRNIYTMFLTISLDIPRIVLAQNTQSMNIHKINFSNTQLANEQMYFLRKKNVQIIKLLSYILTPSMWMWVYICLCVCINK